MPSAPRNIHLHLVDASHGWHICKSLTAPEFSIYRRARVYGAGGQPLDDLVSLRGHAESILSSLSALNVQADEPQGTGAITLFTRMLDARLADEAHSSESVRSCGDWVLALARPSGNASGPSLLVMDLVERNGEVPLNGGALDQAVSIMLLQALPAGASIDQFELHGRFKARVPDQLA